MYTLSSSMGSTTSFFFAYSWFATAATLIPSILTTIQSTTRQLLPYIPQSLRDYIISKFRFLYEKPSPSEMTLIIDEHFNGLSVNEVYEASCLYLQDKICPSNYRTIRVAKARNQKDLSITVNNGDVIIDSYKGINLKWILHCKDPQNKDSKPEKSLHLRFLKMDKEVVFEFYLPYIIEFAKLRKEEERFVKLQALGGGYAVSCNPGSINLNHPSTFDTLAMDPTVKKEIMDDLDRFLDRKDYYRRVEKAWKRGYLLYGPPGTGKSSLVAAMANYLKFHIYDLELTSVRSNMSLRNLLVSTKNRSIIVIEDIDCTIELQNRKAVNNGHGYEHNELTLSGLLNFIDGLWSSCGDQRIIVFTTNYKEKLDPALLRPGRMDMHINMSYLTPCGFRVLAKNYLGLESHPLFTQIEDLIAELEIAPAMVAEQLMKCDNDDPNATLESLICFLHNEKSQKCDDQELNEPLSISPK